MTAASRGLGGDAGSAVGIIGALATLGADILDGGADPVTELERVRERLPARSKAAAKVQEYLRARFGGDATSVYEDKP